MDDSDSESSLSDGRLRPFRIGSVEPIRRTDRAERAGAAEQSGLNVALLDPRLIDIDLHSDSATSPPLVSQLAASIVGVRCAEDPAKRFEVQQEIAALTGKANVVLFAQGRAAEAALMDALPLSGTVAAANCLFPSSRFHFERRGCQVVECPAPGLLDRNPGDLFLGNPDPGRVRDLLYSPGIETRSVWIELACNGAFGQPVSLACLRRTGSLASQLGANLYVDATRSLENAVLARQRDCEAAQFSVRDLVSEMLKGAHAVVASCLKSFHSQFGGFVATDDEALASKLEDLSLARGEGLSGASCAVLLDGLQVASSAEFAEDRCLQAARLHQSLVCAGLPVWWPEAAHAVFVDASRFLRHLHPDQLPAKALALALYLRSGIRVDEHFLPSSLRGLGRSYVRIAIPARRYLDDQIDWVAKQLVALFEHREEVTGLEVQRCEPGLAGSMRQLFSVVGTRARV